jgi:alcohol dehydrogenase class IV
MNVDFGVLRSPNTVLFGPGARASLPTIVRRYGSKVLVCTDPYMATTEAFGELTKALSDSGAEVLVFSHVEAELPLRNVSESVAHARAFAPTVIVGFGGGSAMDLAKLTSLGLTFDGQFSDYYGENNVPGPVLPVVAVPTTAGTGSEVTPVAVLADPERELKVGISSEYLIPVAAVVDPELTYSCPPGVSAHSGIDALAHAIESFTSRRRQPEWSETLPVFVGRNRFTSTLSLEAITSIVPSLPTVVSNPANTAARSQMAYGSLLAGLSFGSGGTHLSHALQYPIGDATKTPHGLGIGLLLPYVLEASLPVAGSSLAEIGRALGVAGTTEEEQAREVVRVVAGLRSEIGIPQTLADIGVTAADLPHFERQAALVVRLVDNAPLEHPADAIGAILERALRGQSNLFETGPLSPPVHSH